VPRFPNLAANIQERLSQQSIKSTAILLKAKLVGAVLPKIFKVETIAVKF